MFNAGDLEVEGKEYVDYNHRQIVLGKLLNKATESGSQIETSAHLLLWYVKAFVCRLPFCPAPCSMLEFPQSIYTERFTF